MRDYSAGLVHGIELEIIMVTWSLVAEMYVLRSIGIVMSCFFFFFRLLVRRIFVVISEPLIFVPFVKQSFSRFLFSF